MTATKPKATPAKLCAKNLTLEEEKRRFIEAAQAAVASRDKGDADLKRVSKPAGVPAAQ